MQHENFTFRNEMIDVSHLSQISADFEWTGKNDVVHNYRVWLRYSNHTYSRELEIDEVQAKDAYVVETHPRLRVFCPERYGKTSHLVGMTADLLQNPKSRVSLTPDHNWTTFQLYAPTNGGQSRYCIFFRLKDSYVQPEGQDLHFLDMHVESAYVRANMVPTVRACPFGHVAYMTKYGLPYH